MAVLNEADMIACEDVRSRTVKEEEETITATVKEEETIASDDVQSRALGAAVVVVEVAETEGMGTALIGAEVVMLNEANMMAHEGIRSIIVKEEEETIAAAMKDVETIASDDVQPWTLGAAVLVVEVAEAEGMRTALSGAEVAMFNEANMMAHEDIRSIIVKEEEETITAAMNDVETIAADDVQPRTPMTAASTGAEAIASEVDGPQVIWNVEEAVDNMPPEEARYNFRSAATTYPSFAGWWAPDAQLQFCGNQAQIQGQQGQGQTNDNSDVGALINQLQGASLSLGKAPIWDGGSSRPGEEFAVVCGFSTALGPLLLERAHDLIYGRKFFPAVASLPLIHVTYMLLSYWKNEVSPFDVAERFFRMVANPKTGTITKVELEPFILAMAQRHPDLDCLSLEEVSQYVNTVLAVVFYRHSNCGVLRSKDLQKSGFVASFNAVGRLEMTLEDSEYFSLERHQTIQKNFWTLSGAGWGVGYDALRKYRHGGEKMKAVGSIRAKKVIDAGRRCVVRDGPFGGATSSGAGYGNTLDYDAFVSFFVCEEALAAGTCSEADVRYCFKIMDDRGEGRLDVAAMRKLYDDVVNEWARTDDKNHNFRTIQQIVSQYFDGMGIEPGRSDVTLAELLEPAILQRAGRFFKEIFTGADLEPEGFPQDSADECVEECWPEPCASGQLQSGYPQWPVDVGQGMNPPVVYDDGSGGFCMPSCSWGLNTAWPNMAYPSPPLHFQPGTAAMGVSCCDSGYSYGAPPPSPPILYPCQQTYSQPIAPYTVGTTGMYAPCYNLGNYYDVCR